VTPFAPEQYIILLLVFLLGLFAGMYLLAGGKWKRRYRELEAQHREELRHRDAIAADRTEARAEAIAAERGATAGAYEGPVRRRRWWRP
jgi:hypothetical protein